MKKKYFVRLPKFLDRGEISLLLITIAFQIISLLTILRVATGVATPTGQQSPGVIVVPKSLNQSVSIPSSTPQFINPIGSGFNSSIMTVILFILANVAVISVLGYLFKKKKMKHFSITISVFLAFNVTYLYATFLIGLDSMIPIGVAAVLVIATLYSAFGGLPKITNSIALLIGLELGSSFPVLLQTPLNWIVPAAYAIFDIYAIYFGRLGRLVTDVGKAETNSGQASENPPRKAGWARWPELGLLTVNLSTMEIGMADIAFYTMVPIVALIVKSLSAFLVVMLVVDFGLVVSFFVFRKKEVSPGLPIPILSGLVALLLLSLFF